MAGPDALISSANGDFVATLAAILALFIMAVCGWVIKWVMKTIPEQMEKDRTAICVKLTEMIDAMNRSTARFDKCFEEHDRQAKNILETDTRIENNLKARPCFQERDWKG
jgi:hypothetical protein